MTTIQAPQRAYPPRRRVPGTCAACGADMQIAENRVDLPNYCPPCRRIARVVYSRNNRSLAGYQERHNAYQRERDRVAREMQNRPQYPADPDRPGYWLVPCSDCRRPVSTHPSRAYGRRVCEVCGRKIKNARGMERYHEQKAGGYVQYTPPSPPKEKSQKTRRDSSTWGHYYKAPLTLLHDCGDFRKGAHLAMLSWEEIVGYGDMDAAEWEDADGARWCVRDGKVVKA